jgi:hypothetical protein
VLVVVLRCSGAAVAQLLLLASNPSMLSHLADGARVQALCSSSVPKPFDQIVGLHLRSLYASHTQQAALAIQLQTQAADMLYAVLEADREPSNWLLAPINVVARHLRLASYAADAALVRSSLKARHMVEVQDVLKRFLQRMITDRAPGAQSKKLGCLFIIVHLFKVYFKLNSLNLGASLVKMVAQLPPLREFPIAQQVAYQFYLGRLKVFEEKYDEAEQCLDFAFQHCPRVSPANKRRVLHFLVPVKLSRGRFPQERLLSKYGLNAQFGPLVLAIKRGDLSAFNNQMAAQQRFFVHKGIYLILEKLKISVYRNLFRKVHAFHVASVPADAPNAAALHKQLPLDLLLAALRVNGATDMTLEELECILANLIFHNKIKGYIAHKRCVVLSKQDPFPRQA